MLRQSQSRILVKTPGRGLLEVTARVAGELRASGIREGLLTLFVRHTSASLLVQENADAEVRRDLERWFSRLVQDGDPLFRHRSEGPDDMPAHVRGALTAVQLSIPVDAGRLLLGTWQGIYLWEHRQAGHDRELVVHIGGE
jgi:secondary thiamine-phosphate synthase enzyme